MLLVVVLLYFCYTKDLVRGGTSEHWSWFRSWYAWVMESVAVASLWVLVLIPLRLDNGWLRSTVVNINNTNQINAIKTPICKSRNFMHQHAEQWISYRTIRFRFRPDTPTEIRPHSVPVEFKTNECGTSQTLNFLDGFHGFLWPFLDLIAHWFIFCFALFIFFVWFVC